MMKLGAGSSPSLKLGAGSSPSLILLAIIAMILPLTGCNDDTELFFTKDEIVGDIITGKQIPIDNHLTGDCGSYLKVNVGNAKGNVTVTPANAEMLEVEIYKYQSRHPELTLRLKASGETALVVKDEKGRVGTLYLIIKDGEQPAPQNAIYLSDFTTCLLPLRRK